MAETTTQAVKADIEATRERMSVTLSQLERKLDVMQLVKDHPLPALAIALGAGFALSGSKADVKAAAAAAAATKGATSKVGDMLDDIVAGMVGTVTAALAAKAGDFVGELKGAAGRKPLADAAPYEHRLSASASPSIDPEQFRGTTSRDAALNARAD